jgi:hypothetical protein
MTKQAQKLSEKLLDEPYPLILLIQEIAALERDRDNWKRVALNLGAIEENYDQAVKEINHEQNKTY